ncbi:hypothetical protein INS49_002648 [Diaporthe citri]|uniref:uncharacterized protein n=1 Tax=Diaporthe citri TaxID=83186 RepID=UPI001C7FD107|nr:uncharacterized protein INS49_002648 [Diaporthe citri]KAG6368441.1 hypothetical protein INS49_002648 [Diaporthe citri]
MAALLPPHRTGSYWAKTHSNNVKKFMGKTVAGCIKLIQACKSIEDLIMLMNEGNRYFAWNFMNLDQDHLKTGTVQGLKEFTSNGLVDGASDVRYLNAVFSNKTGAATLVTPEIPSNAELETKVKEDQKKNLMLRKLSEKLAAEAAARKAAASAGNGRGNGGRRF